jgi:hypothetical protein
MQHLTPPPLEDKPLVDLMAGDVEALFTYERAAEVELELLRKEVGRLEALLAEAREKLSCL